MAFGGIVADQQDGRSASHVAHGGCSVLFPGDGAGEAREVGGAVVVDVIGPHHGASELLQEIIFFVGRAIGANHPNRLPSFAVANLAQAPFPHAQ